MKVSIWPKSIYADNKYDPTSDAIVEAIKRVNRTVGYVLPAQPVKVTITADFVTFGGIGDREEPNIELEYNKLTEGP